MNFGKGFLAGVIVVSLQTLLTRTLEFIYNSHLTKPCINEVTGQENSIGLSQWLLYHSRGNCSVD